MTRVAGGDEALRARRGPDEAGTAGDEDVFGHAGAFFETGEDSDSDGCHVAQTRV